MNNGDYIATQQLLDIKRIMGPELSLACDVMAMRLGYVNSTSLNAARHTAELREAKKIVQTLKHPDAENPVHSEDMAWALMQVIDACETFSLSSVAMTMRNIASMLGIDVTAHHDIPRDLDRKIGNAVKVLLHSAPQPVMAAAV